MSEPCRFGRIEYDGAQYCFEHGGFRWHILGRSSCNQATAPGARP